MNLAIPGSVPPPRPLPDIPARMARSFLSVGHLALRKGQHPALPEASARIAPRHPEMDSPPGRFTSYWKHLFGARAGPGRIALELRGRIVLDMGSAATMCASWR